MSALGLPAPQTRTDLERRVLERLATVHDPEIRRPITDLGMVESVVESAPGVVEVEVLLTIAACPLRGTIHADVAAAVADVPGCGSVDVRVGVMEPERRLALQDALRAARPTNPFGEDTLTRVLAVASGKGGVGKSSVTANLAVALAARGLAVGLIDADVHGYSIPGLLGVTATPTKLDRMILPPVVRDVKVISIGMFLDADRPVAWRGPMLHRALEQFVTDVHWGDLDVLLVDLPPGTGDIAISTAQLLPASELLVVTTPQHAAAQVAARAGQLAEQTGQTVAGVVENMGPMTLPDGTVLDVFGTDGGAEVAERLSGVLGTQVPLLGTVPLDPALRAGGDAGDPVVVSSPESPAGRALAEIAQRLAVRPRGLAGRRLPVTPR
ncbi:Mrp/NBP35 family ATP-binding protein [Micrococcus luteus]|uniref:Mrp/NBP35 family ATP-binding protein n=1 Tax=Micrococcus luteus TaxID=1270 RepID=UPI00200529A9|nr:P-loop NTPase [Micrococcus luteus]MCK6057755.1 Mrp/NBP35 family ATP-binding protein [Micrococcus luteus]MCK6061678.1 Mrp/NBP35 family ATP-binding protein [Micrococcus luteus]MCK6063801.1 Mrp/NBP35 family ATP-binding protein [Micrococcus luteus]MCK6193300.1 Mrp/NBP35 family ATP-binding protein [Micrococcus luteus]MCK6195163.1 Mrp/NBP35 family ATP-binding protein [Micrococcus luteus]